MLPPAAEAALLLLEKPISDEAKKEEGAVPVVAMGMGDDIDRPLTEWLELS